MPILPIVLLGAFVWLRYRNYTANVQEDPAAEEVRKLRFFIETAVMVGVAALWLVLALG